ncbi:hypothetical protein HK101_010615 [Irineochytrium annulatum]|nr:hypothetical protein HK101_010615 [Irineochytrium annulatum]
MQTQKRLNFESRSADQIRREVEDLLRRQRIVPRPKPSKEYKAKEAEVMECYNKNPGRTLDCWREVEGLKAAYKKAETEFVESMQPMHA